MIPSNGHNFVTSVVILLGFLFGLGMPRYSVLALLVSLGILFRRSTSFPRLWRLTLPVLLGFTILHEGISVYFGFRAPWILILHPVIFLSAYLCGYFVSIDPNFNKNNKISLFIMAICTGMAFFAFMGSRGVTAGVGLDSLRIAPSIWNRNQYINGTIFGLYASAGMTLLPVVLFAGRTLIKINKIDWTIAAIASVLGVFANVVFQNRSPFVAVAVVFFVISMDLATKYYADKFQFRKLLWRFSLIALFATGLLVFYFKFIELVFIRFQSQGLSSGGRFKAWFNVLSHILEQPFGGRKIYLAGVTFAHNLWLDVANDSGMIPCLLLITFFGLHFGFIVRMLKSPPCLEKFVIVGFGTSLAIGAMLEPFLIGSPLHFASLCLLLGLISGRGTGSLNKTDLS